MSQHPALLYLRNPEKGKIGLQLHGGVHMKMSFKTIKLKPIAPPPAKALDLTCVLLSYPSHKPHRIER